MAETEAKKSLLNTEQFVQDILATLGHDREREIVARRFGLFDRKETLEQIGELLGITRERVRQLEKAVIARLRTAGEHLPHINDVQATFITELHGMGEAARISDLGAKLTKDNSRLDQARIAFLAQLCPALAIIDDNDFYYHAVGIAAVRDEQAIKSAIANIIDAIKKLGEPTTIEKIAPKANISDVKQAEALAS